MAGRKKENFDRERVEFKAPPEWIERATKMANKLGFNSLSAFIRVTVTQFMDEADAKNPKGKKG